MTYEAWRCTFQSSEQAARSAYRQVEELVAEVGGLRESHADSKRLTKELDILLNGDGAASQASLCDLVAQLNALPVSFDMRCGVLRSAKQELDQLKAQVAELDRDLLKEVDTRDKYHEHADRLAFGIGNALGLDIGEHSSMNCPWNNAFFAINEFNIAAHDAEVIGRQAKRIRQSVEPGDWNCKAVREVADRLDREVSELRASAEVAKS